MKKTDYIYRSEVNLIFLDIDGVLATPSSNNDLDPFLLRRLGRIIEATDAFIVITSSWRRNTLQETKDFLSGGNRHARKYPFPFIDRIVGQTDRWYAFQKGVESRHRKTTRGFQIEKYIELFDPWKTYHYVIIDDDPNMLVPQLPHFIQTDPNVGITELDVDKAISILRSSK